MNSMHPTLEQERAEFEAARSNVLTFARTDERIDALAAMSRLIDEADDLGAEGANEIAAIAKTLQLRRAFGLLLILCMLAGRSGLSTPKLAQMETQALIELGRLREAIRSANRLADATFIDVAVTENDKQREAIWMSAMGNVGRAYKQLYMNAATSERRADPMDLREAARVYLDVWQRGEKKDSTYHAINAAALIQRAVRDRELDPEGSIWAKEEDARNIAETILDIHRDDIAAAFEDGQGSGDIWALATCGEASLVLGRVEDAARFYGAYAGHPEISAFNLAASARQLNEVWGYNGEDMTPEGAIVRMLKGALLNLESGAGELDPDAVAQTESIVMSIKEARLLEGDLLRAEQAESPTPPGMETYLAARAGADDTRGMIEIHAIAGAMRRARSICAIQTLRNGEMLPIGTGFVIRGEVLSPDWQGQTFIVTNHHVTSEGDGHLSSSFSRCSALFVDIDPLDGKQVQYTAEFDGIQWSSPPDEHDTVVLKLRDPLPAEIVPLTDRDMSDYLPKRRELERDGTDMHVVILGFPGGGPLSYSFGDEMLLDHDACDPGLALDSAAEASGRPVRLHYRTPSRPGSSGSPVFQARTWKLVGIHHGGFDECPRLPPKTQTYRGVNEGIWLPSIRAAIASPDTANPEFLALSDSARRAVQAVADGSLRDVAEQVFARPIQTPGTSAPATPATAIGFPGNPVRMPQDSTDIGRIYLREGVYTGDMNAFHSGGLETVIGNDDRQQVLHTTADPFRMICSLVIEHADHTTNFGTGFLVGRRTLITAGHCVMPYPGAAAITAIKVYPGRSGPTRPFEDQLGAVYGERYSVHDMWASRYDPHYDIGAIHLTQDIGDTLGWFRVGAPPAAQLMKRWSHVTGYPGDKLGGNAFGRPERASELWHHATPIAHVSERQVFYPSDTFAGQSGAPVYVLDDDKQARVVAVHAYGVGNNGDKHARKNNSGVLLDGPIMQILADWRTV